MSWLLALQVHYMWQTDGSSLGDHTVTYNEAELWGYLQRHMRVWEGLVAPVKVAGDELWKCHRCLFNTHCYDPRNAAKPGCKRDGQLPSAD